MQNECKFPGSVRRLCADLFLLPLNIFMNINVGFMNVKPAQGGGINVAFPY